MPILTTTCTTLAGGVDAVAGEGQVDRFTVAGTWLVGDTIQILLLDTTSGVLTQIGFGAVSGLLPTYVFTYKNRLYVLVGSRFYFCALNDPTTFNDPNGVGNGFVDIQDNFGTSEDLVSVTVFQGTLAFFTANNVQIWQVDPDPANFNLQQNLANTGAIAKNSVQSIGELETIYLSNTGFRSLRARETSLNAYVEDLGSPIDSLVQDKLINSTALQIAAACSVVEPQTNRYWCFLTDTIYVLSYFPNSKIVGWSIYQPTYIQAGLIVTFAPTLFLTHLNQVWARDGDNFFQYGGSNGNTYDTIPCIAETPWLENKTPATIKKGTAVDASFTGTWKIEASMDMTNGTYEQVFNGASPSATYEGGTFAFTSEGTHFRMRATCTSMGLASLGALIFHYDKANEK